MHVRVCEGHNVEHMYVCEARQSTSGSGNHVLQLNEGKRVWICTFDVAVASEVA